MLRETQGEVRAYLASLGVPLDCVDDLAQEVYPAWFRAPVQRPDGVEPVRWLKGIARRMALNFFRQSRRREERSGFVAQVKQAMDGAGVAAASGDEFVAAVERRVGLEPSRSLFAQWRQWFAHRPRVAWSFIAAAACVVLVASVLWLAPSPAAQIATTQGDVRVWRKQVTHLATSGFKLQAGDWLLTGTNGSVTVAFPGETTRLDLGTNAEFGVVATQSGVVTGDAPVAVLAPPPAQTLVIGGAIQENRAATAKANPITYLGKGVPPPPFLIMHGDSDRTVPFNQSELLRDALQAAHADVTFRPVPGAGHGFGGEKNIAPVREFLERVFPSRADAIPTKSKPEGRSGI